MRRLSDPVKRRIVEHLACYRTHAEVVDLIAEEFDVTLTSRHVRAYDPMSFQFAGAQKWRDYFTLVRERFAKEINTIAISHRRWRLRQLERIYKNAIDATEPDFEAARKALEQAAKEVGNIYVR